MNKNLQPKKLMPKNLIPIFLLLGCAYNFKGYVANPNIHSVAIPVFENKTVRYGLEEVFTKKIIDAFIKDNRLKVLDKEKAESILLGEITGYSRTPFSYDDQANVKDYKVEIMLKLTYQLLNPTNSTNRTLTDWYVYSAQETEEIGIEKLCDKFSDDIVRSILEE
ncbi:MAG: hypothetical protein HY769_07915 [Candidatus Stahlbacteria bacterium]|nr:hypothetical protein [Candidatus Stahlbacteria bacterium]